MTPHILRVEQFVPRPIDEVFEFFAKAENLEEITPPWLHFRILSVNPNPICKGALLRYSLRWRIIPLRWTTEITEWEPPHRFVDEQRKGPYKLWRHEHTFVAEGSGTRITDEVRYAEPFGLLGSLAHRMKVKKDVEAIFAHRRKVVQRLFGSSETADVAP